MNDPNKNIIIYEISNALLWINTVRKQLVWSKAIDSSGRLFELIINQPKTTQERNWNLINDIIIEEAK
jgi:hypothetical protein